MIAGCGIGSELIELRCWSFPWVFKCLREVVIVVGVGILFGDIVGGFADVGCSTGEEPTEDVEVGRSKERVESQRIGGVRY